MISTSQARGTISKFPFLSAGKRLYIKFIVYFRTLYQDISLQTLPDLRSDFKKVRHKSHFVQVSIQYTYGQLCMYIQASPFEIETETH
jgi:hypothetical protein